MIYETANEALAIGWDEEIKIVLEAIYRFEGNGKRNREELEMAEEPCHVDVTSEMIRKICIFTGQC